MNINAEIVLTKETEKRFQNFIVFEPSSVRIKEADILFQGEKVVELFEQVQAKIEEDTSLDAQIIQNRMRKIGQMLQLLTSYDGLIMTKFFDKVWRRYSAISNIGEFFLDLPAFLGNFPENEKSREKLLTIRIEDDEEDFESSATATDEDDKSDTNEDKEDKENDADSKKPSETDK
jgi:hypothetical protein